MTPSAGSTISTPARRVTPRWWPAWLILGLTALGIVYVLVLRDEPSYQHRNMAVMGSLIVATVALLLWTMFFSRLRWKTRWLAFGGVVAVLALTMALFEFHGVDGDLVPILKFRWRHTAPAAVERPASPQPVGPDQTMPGRAFLWPQFLGPFRNSTLPDGPKLACDWNAQPPLKLWRQPIGAAWSGFAIVDNRAVTLEQRGNEEWVVCYELLTGRRLWNHADAAHFHSPIAGDGPQTTPTIVGNKVVALGGTGILNCLDLATGKAVWSKNVLVDNQSRVGTWGVAGSPLVLGGSIIVNPGGTNRHSLVAYRLDSGERLWSGGDDEASYCSPCVATLCGVPQVLIFNEHALFGHDQATGRVLWKYPWDSTHEHIAQPIVLDGDRVLISSGYGVGSHLVQVQRDAAGRFTAKPLWKTRKLKSKFNNMVTRGGFVYGLDDGTLACVERATGALKWREGRYGHGQFILVQGLLLITAENGEVVLVDPVPDGRRELAKFPALSGKTWNPPALAGDLLLVRNDEEAACYRLPVTR